MGANWLVLPAVALLVLGVLLALGLAGYGYWRASRSAGSGLSAEQLRSVKRQAAAFVIGGVVVIAVIEVVAFR
jgi:hypothetical protein